MDDYETILWITVYANVLGIHHHPKNQDANYDFHDRARNAAERAIAEYRKCLSSRQSESSQGSRGQEPA